MNYNLNGNIISQLNIGQNRGINNENHPNSNPYENINNLNYNDLMDLNYNTFQLNEFYSYEDSVTNLNNQTNGPEFLNRNKDKDKDKNNKK